MKDELPDLTPYLSKKGGNSQAKGNNAAPKADISEKLSALVKKPGTMTGTNVPAVQLPLPGDDLASDINVSDAHANEASAPASAAVSNTDWSQVVSEGHGSHVDSYDENGSGEDDLESFDEVDTHSAPQMVSSSEPTQSIAASATNSPHGAPPAAMQPTRSVTSERPKPLSNPMSMSIDKFRSPQARPMNTLSSGSAPPILKPQPKTPQRSPQTYSYRNEEGPMEGMAPKAVPTPSAPKPMVPRPQPASVTPPVTPAPTPAPAPVAKAPEPVSMPVSAPVAMPVSDIVPPAVEKMVPPAESTNLHDSNNAVSANPRSSQSKMTGPKQNLSSSLFDDEIERPVTAAAEPDREALAKAFAEESRVQEGNSALAKAFAEESKITEETDTLAKAFAEEEQALSSKYSDGGASVDYFSDAAPTAPLGFGNLLGGSSSSSNEDEHQHSALTDLMTPTGQQNTQFAAERQSDETAFDEPDSGSGLERADDRSQAPAFSSMYSSFARPQDDAPSQFAPQEPAPQEPLEEAPAAYAEVLPEPKAMEPEPEAPKRSLVISKLMESLNKSQEEAKDEPKQEAAQEVVSSFSEPEPVSAQEFISEPEFAEEAPAPFQSDSFQAEAPREAWDRPAPDSDSTTSKGFGNLSALLGAAGGAAEEQPKSSLFAALSGANEEQGQVDSTGIAETTGKVENQEASEVAKILAELDTPRVDDNEVSLDELKAILKKEKQAKKEAAKKAQEEAKRLQEEEERKAMDALTSAIDSSASDNFSSPFAPPGAATQPAEEIQHIEEPQPVQEEVKAPVIEKEKKGFDYENFDDRPISEKLADAKRKEENKSSGMQDEEQEDPSLGDAIGDALDKLLQGEEGATPIPLTPTGSQAAQSHSGLNKMPDAEKILEEKIAASANEPESAQPIDPMTMTQSKVDALSRLLEVASKAPEKKSEDAQKPQDSATKLAEIINKPQGKVSRQMPAMENPYADGQGAQPSPYTSPFSNPSSSMSNQPSQSGRQSQHDVPQAPISGDAVSARIAALNRKLDEQSKPPSATFSGVQAARATQSQMPPMSGSGSGDRNSGVSSTSLPMAPPPMNDYGDDGGSKSELVNRILEQARLGGAPADAPRGPMPEPVSIEQVQQLRNAKTNQKQKPQREPAKKPSRSRTATPGMNPAMMLGVVFIVLAAVGGAGYFAVQQGYIKVGKLPEIMVDKTTVEQHIKNGDYQKAREMLEAKAKGSKLSASDQEKLCGVYYSLGEELSQDGESSAEAVKVLEKITSKSKKYKDAQKLIRKLKKKVKKS